MEAIIFMGIQASGKSTFFVERFFQSHVRLSLDLLKTRHRERVFLETCIATLQPLVIDNTNPRKTDRARYIPLLQKATYQIHGYYFQSAIETCLKRNAMRTGKAQIPEAGVRHTHAQLELPSFHEGFNKLYYVSIENDRFSIKDWQDEV